VPSTLHPRAWAKLAKGLAAAWIAASSLAAFAQPTNQPLGIDPAAQRLLKASTDFLAGRNAFAADTRNSLEVVLHSGQKIQFNHVARLAVQRPNKLRAERSGDLVEQVFIFDGQALTLFNPADKTFATVAAPPTIEGMLDFAQKSLTCRRACGRLIYTNAYDILMQDVVQGFIVGKAVIEGVRCDHLAFRNPFVDMQIWIQEGPQPLPRKMVLTSRDVFNAPQFSVTITQWDLQPRFDAQTFVFTPPAGAKQIDFLAR
jgi:hypothetical protein